jgi:hypothetical protein
MADNPFAPFMQDDPFAPWKGVLPTETPGDGPILTQDPNTFIGRTEKYFKTGVDQLKHGAGGFVKEVLNPKAPQRLSEFDADIDLMRPVRQVRNIGEVIGGGIRAALSYPAGAVSQAVIPPIQKVEEWLGDKSGTVSKPIEELMPDILALFGGAGVSRMRAGRSRALLGENPPPPRGALATSEGFELPRNAANTPNIPITPRTTIPEVDVAARYAEEMATKASDTRLFAEQARVEGAVKQSTADQLRADMDLEEILRGVRQENRTHTNPSEMPPPYKEPVLPTGKPFDEPGMADAGAEGWFPRAGGPTIQDIAANPKAYPKDQSVPDPIGPGSFLQGPRIAARLRAEGGQAVRSQARGILDREAELKAATEKERYDRLFAMEDPNSRITRTPSTKPSIDEGSVINIPKSDYTIWPERTSGGAQPGDITQMHGGFPVDSKKIAEYIKSLPGVSRLIDATATPRAYITGPSKSDAYLTATREVKGGYALAAQEVDNLALGLDKQVSKAMKNDSWAHAFTKDEVRMRVDLAYGGDTKAIPANSNLGQAIAKAGEIRDNLTKMQAERGIISEAAAAKPGYAKQVYARDLLGGNEWAKRITPDARAKGIEHILNTEQIKVGNTYRGVTPDEAAAIAESIITEGHTGRFAPRIKSPYSANSGSTKARQSIPVPIKNLMGVVDDGVYRIARSIHDSTNLVISHDFLKGFSEGSEIVRGVKTEWVSPTPRMGYTRVQMNDFSRRAMGKNPKEDLYILDKYADDFAGTYGVNSNIDNFTIWDNLFNPLNTMFKASKTIYNPATHGRNILGNVIFSSGAGNSLTNPMNIRYYAKALKEAWTQGPIYKDAVSNGTIGPGFSTQELKLMADKYHSNKGNFWGFFKDLSIESAGQMVGNALPTLAKAYVNNPVGKVAGKVYNLEDQVFKLASYIKQRELGMSARDASLHVNKFFPRYDELSPLVQGLAQGKGQVVGSPFASFAAESIRIGKNMAADNPTLFAAWAFGVPALSYAAQGALGLSNAEMAREYQRIPPELRNKFGTWILPMRDEQGNVQFIDTTYWHPLGQFYKGVMDPGISNQISNMPFIQDFVGGNPIFTLAMEVMKNTQLSPYTRGDQIKRPSQGNEAYFEHMIKTMAPPLAPFGTGSRQIMAAVTKKPARFGQKKSVLDALVGEVTPFRVTAIDPAITRFTQGLQRSENRRVDEDLRRLTSEYYAGKVKPDEFPDRLQHIQDAVKAIQEKYYVK